MHVCVCTHARVHMHSIAHSCMILRDPMDCRPLTGPLSMEFSRQEYWCGLSFPTPGYLPHLGIETTSLASPALAGGFFTTESSGKHQAYNTLITQNIIQNNLI